MKGGEVLDVIKKKDNVFKIVDKDKNIDCQYDNGKISGKGSRKFKEDIMEAVNVKYNDELVDTIYDSAKKQKYLEMFTLSGLANSWGTSATLNDVSIRDLHRWQKNPVQYNKELRNLALYYYGQKGIITDVYEMYKTLPNLNSSIFCNNPKGEKYKEYMEKISEFESFLNNPIVIRNVIFEALFGTAVGYIRNKKHVQILDLNIYKPVRKINNRWQVQCDLSYFESHKGLIDSQPKEVVRAYNKYKTSKDRNSYRYYDLDINNTFVIKIRSKDNEPFGRPIAMSAFDDLLHKELLKEAEKAIIDRLVSQLITIKLGEGGEKGYHPTKEQQQKVYNAVKTILDDEDKSKIKFAGIPFWAEIDTLKVDLGIFDEKKYIQIDKDILVDLGVSAILSQGQGGSYSSGDMNVQIFFQKIFEIVEQIEEEIFNVQYKQIVNDKEYTFKKKFSRAITLGNSDRIKSLKELVDMGFSVKFLLDELGINFEEYVKQTMYEQDTLDLPNQIRPYMKSYTLSDSADKENPNDNTGVKKDNEEKEV